MAEDAYSQCTLRSGNEMAVINTMCLAHHRESHMKTETRPQAAADSANGADRASIAQRYLCTARRGTPLTPMPPAGGTLRRAPQKGASIWQKTPYWNCASGSMPLKHISLKRTPHAAGSPAARICADSSCKCPSRNVRPRRSASCTRLSTASATTSTRSQGASMRVSPPRKPRHRRCSSCARCTISWSRSHANNDRSPIVDGCYRVGVSRGYAT